MENKFFDEEKALGREDFEMKIEVAEFFIRKISNIKDNLEALLEKLANIDEREEEVEQLRRQIAALGKDIEELKQNSESAKEDLRRIVPTEDGMRLNG